MSEQIGTGTAQGAIEFLDNLVEKGRAAPGSVSPLKSAVKRVLSEVDGENWKNIDIRKIDVTDYISRFQNLTIGKFDSKSYPAYNSRLQKAITWYKNFLTQPGWAPPIKKETNGQTGKKVEKNSSPNQKISRVDNNSDVLTQPKTEASGITGDFISYPFPLLDGRVVTFYLPKDLKINDIKRISNYLLGLAVDNEVESK